MHVLKRMWRLSSDERRLVLEAIFALGAASFAVSVLPLRRIAAAKRRISSTATIEEDRVREVARVRWAVAACAGRVPWRAKCFERGLAARWMLGRRQIPTTLHYGVARREDQGLAAHVWLKSGSLDVVGCENRADFCELARFPADP
jgi:hypothetical protein